MKKIIALLLALLLVCSLAACGAKEEAPAAPADKAPAAAPADAPAEEIVLKYVTFRGEDVEVNEKINAMFEEANPGIKIEMETKSADQDEYYANLKTKLAGDEAVYDIIAIHPGTWTETFAAAGELVDLTDAAVCDLYADSQINDMKTTDGKVYGLPQAFSAYLIFYNKGIFDKYGLEVPTTWAEMEALCKTLSDNGEGTVAVGFGESWVFDLHICPLLSSYCPDNVDMLYDLQTGAMKWDDPAIVSAYTDMQKMKDAGFFINGAEGTGYDASIALFAQGRAAMLSTGTWSVGGLKEQAPDMEMGFFVLPNSQDQFAMSTDLGQAIAITADSTKKEAAMKYLEFISSPEIAQIYADTTMQFAAVTGVSSDIPELQAVNALLEKYDCYRSASVFPTDTKFLELYVNAAAKAYNGADIAQLMAECQAETDALG